MNHEYHGICKKCRKRKTCKAPCAPVETYINQDRTYTVYERRDGDRIIAYPRHKEVQRSCVEAEFDSSGDPMSMVEELFSTDADLAFDHYEPKLERTRVFIERLFKRKSWADIASLLNTNSERVRAMFKDSTKRMLKALEVMDKRRGYIDDVESRLKISEKSSGKMPKSHKWFLMNKVFGLLPREIAEMEGANIKNVCSKIRYVADRVITGHEIFMRPTGAEVEKARRRVEQKRQCGIRAL